MSDNPNKSTEPTQPGEKEGNAAEFGTKPTTASTPTVITPQAPKPETQQTQTPVKAEPQRAMPQGLTQAVDKNQLNYPNPHPSMQLNPFQSGHNYNQVSQSDNFFTLVLDSSQHIHDAIAFFSEEKNRNRYTYDQQQLIISRIVRACQEFGIELEGVSNRFAT